MAMRWLRLHIRICSVDSVLEGLRQVGGRGIPADVGEVTQELLEAEVSQCWGAKHILLHGAKIVRRTRVVWKAILVVGWSRGSKSRIDQEVARHEKNRSRGSYNMEIEKTIVAHAKANCATPQKALDAVLFCDQIEILLCFRAILHNIASGLLGTNMWVE
jgi:hypothetical protein